MISRPRRGAGAALSSFYGLSSLSALYSSPNQSETSVPEPAHEDFASRILDLELQLQHNCNLQLINALMEAYSVPSTQRAIEHYECSQDPKHVQLQERMHAFLVRKDVMSVLRPSPPKRPSPSPSPERLSEEAEHKKSHSMQLLEQLQGSDPPKQQDLPKQRKVERLLNTAHLEVKAAVTNVHADLKLQNEQLKHRLDCRKERSASLTRNERVHTEGHDGECDEEEEMRRPRACYEDELERLVEELVRRRQRERLEVEEKYSSQRQELESYSKGGNSLITRVIEELNRSRDQEIATLEAKITQERAKAIADLKAKHMRQIY